jgi:hypothetical protein
VQFNDSEFVLMRKRQDDHPVVSIEDVVTVNRKTGAISVIKTFINPSYRQDISYNGTCEKVSRIGKKF